jgi:hypothetical protein
MHGCPGLAFVMAFSELNGKFGDAARFVGVAESSHQWMGIIVVIA